MYLPNRKDLITEKTPPERVLFDHYSLSLWRGLHNYQKVLLQLRHFKIRRWHCVDDSFMVVSKRSSPRFEQYTGDVRIKQVHRCYHLSSTITGDGKYDTEIKRVGKYVFLTETNQRVKREKNDSWRREMKRENSENNMENRNSERMYTYNQKESVETFETLNEG